MAKKTRLDRVLIVDFELTCWEGTPPPGQSPEIIDVGIVEVDVENLEAIRAERFLVRPKWSEVSEYCTDLTGITAGELRRHGRRFPEVAAGLRRKWGTASKLWVSWGRDDVAVRRDAERHGVENPFSESFQNLGLEHTIETGASANVSLHEAMRELGIEPGPNRHSALNDALDLSEVWRSKVRTRRELRMQALDSGLNPL